MTIKDIVEELNTMFHDVVSDIKIENDSFTCVWYKAIISEGRFVHKQLELSTDSIGIWKSVANSISPTDFVNYDKYLMGHAIQQLKDFNEFCLKLLPDKYLEFYRNGLKSDKYRTIESKDGFEGKLKEIFNNDVSDVLQEESLTFVVYETLCFDLQIGDTYIILRRIYRNNKSIELMKIGIDSWEEKVLTFLYEYAYCIVPDEWLIEYTSIN